MFRTLKQINAYIDKKYHNGLRLCHSDGYFWFIDELTIKEPPKSIYVCYIKNLPAKLIDESIKEWEYENENSKA
jgi:hypothetical protein